MTEVAKREIRDQISRPRVEEAESSWSRRETTTLRQPGTSTFTSATSNTTPTATPAVRLTAASERMPSPTTTAQPHWTTLTKPTPKGKELENKPVKDQTAKDFQEKDMRNHWSGYNDEDEDHLKLDIERIDEEEGQDPNKETGQNDLPNQVSRISNNQVPGVETQHQHDDCHSQVYGRHSQALGVEPQISTSRVPDNNQGAGVEAQQPASGDEPDNCHSQVYGRHSQTPGVESQVPTTRMSANKQVPQVSTPRELDNQVTGLETQLPAYGKPHKQANEDEHDVHNQVSRRDSNQETGLEAQNSTEEKHHNQVQGKHNQELGVELQIPTPRGPHYQVTGREVQGSGSGESRDQPPCCLTHSYKSNIVFTERLLLRNSSKDQDNTERLLLRNSSKDQDKSDKKFKKTVRVLEVMNWWRAVFELSVLTTAFHVSMGPGFHYSSTRKLKQQTGVHNNSPKNLKSPQTSLGQRVQQQAGEEDKKDISGEPGETGRVSYVKILLILLAVWFEVSTKEAASNSNRVHQFTNPDGQGMIVYRRSGENLEFLNDCLATQIEAIIKELEKGCQSDPKFWSLINHQKRPQNETIIEKLETRECSDPRPLIPLRNKKELQKGGRSTPKFLGPIKNRKGSKNEMIYGELENRGRSDRKFWTLKRDQKEFQNQTSLELEKSGHNNPRLLDLIRNKKRSKNEISKKELKEGGRDHQRFWILKRDQVEPQNKTSWELEGGGCDYHEFWILKRDQVEFQNKTSWELEGGG